MVFVIPVIIAVLVFFAALRLGHEAGRSNCYNNCNCKKCRTSSPEQTAPTYTYTATQNKTTSTTRL